MEQATKKRKDDQAAELQRGRSDRLNNAGFNEDGAEYALGWADQDMKMKGLEAYIASSQPHLVRRA
jgi:hypothetical protein